MKAMAMTVSAKNRIVIETSELKCRYRVGLARCSRTGRLDREGLA
jgi:hypothetical protein